MSIGLYGYLIANKTFKGLNMKDRIITCQHSRKDKKFCFTAYNRFVHNGIINSMVCFKHTNKNSFYKNQDSTWIKYTSKPKNIDELEKILGLSITAWE